MKPLTEDTRKSLEKAAEPLMKWLCKNCHPHVKVIVEQDRVELLEGQCLMINDEFVLD